MESKVEIFIEYGKETFIIEFPREITYSKLKDLLLMDDLDDHCRKESLIR